MRKVYKLQVYKSKITSLQVKNYKLQMEHNNNAFLGQTN